MPHDISRICESPTKMIPAHRLVALIVMARSSSLIGCQLLPDAQYRRELLVFQPTRSFLLLLPAFALRASCEAFRTNSGQHPSAPKRHVVCSKHWAEPFMATAGGQHHESNDIRRGSAGRPRRGTQEAASADAIGRESHLANARSSLVLRHMSRA